MNARSTACERIRLITFGYKHINDARVAQTLADVDLMINVRFIANPYHETELKELDGSREEVRDFVFNQTGVREFVTTTEAMILCALDRYLTAAGDNFREIKIAFGCAGGRQRSVVMALHFEEVIKNHLRKQLWEPAPQITVDHLTIDFI